MIRFAVNLWLTLWLSFLTAAAVQSHRPANLSGVKGLDPAGGKAGAPNLLERMEQAAWHRTEELTITESQANRYLAEVVNGKQGKSSFWAARFDKIALDFEPGFCRVWFIWKSAGHRCTASLDFTIRREGSNFITEVQGGSYGRLPILRRGALAALVPACRSLCDSLWDNEIYTLFQMNQIRFEKDKLVLDPRFESVK